MKYRNESNRNLRVAGQWVKQSETFDLGELTAVEVHMVNAGDLVEVKKNKPAKTEVNDDGLQSR